MKKTAKQHVYEKNCLNCGTDLPDEALYCPLCSQKRTTGRISVGSLLGEFFSEVLNIESRLFVSLRDLFIPGRLTEVYFAGKHKRYFTPLRLFLVMGVLHFTLLGYFIERDLSPVLDKFQHQREEEAVKSVWRQQFDSTAQAVLQDLPAAQVRGGQLLLDSLRAHLGGVDTSLNNTRSQVGYFSYAKGKFDVHELNISQAELYSWTPERIIAEKKITDPIAQIQVRQFVKLIQRPDQFTGFILGKLIWMVAAMILAMALLMKLLYIRRGYYYVEHLVFNLHYHTIAFLLISLSLGIAGGFTPESGISGIAVLLMQIYLLIALRRYYRQGWIKTFFKFCIYNFSYLIIFTLFLSITFVITALLY